MILQINKFTYIIKTGCLFWKKRNAICKQSEDKFSENETEPVFDKKKYNGKLLIGLNKKCIAFFLTTLY